MPTMLRSLDCLYYAYPFLSLNGARGRSCPAGRKTKREKRSFGLTGGLEGQKNEVEKKITRHSGFPGGPPP